MPVQFASMLKVLPAPPMSTSPIWLPVPSMLSPVRRVMTMQQNDIVDNLSIFALRGSDFRRSE